MTSHKTDQRIQYEDTVSSFPVIVRSELYLTPCNKTIPLIMIDAAEFTLSHPPFFMTSNFWILFHNRIAWLKICSEIKKISFSMVSNGISQTSLGIFHSNKLRFKNNAIHLFSILAKWWIGHKWPVWWWLTDKTLTF